LHSTGPETERQIGSQPELGTLGQQFAESANLPADVFETLDPGDCGAGLCNALLRGLGSKIQALKPSQENKVMEVDQYLDSLKEARKRKDSAKILELLQTIRDWEYGQNGEHAEVILGNVRVSVYPLGGGINTYKELSARVRWENGDCAFLGAFSAEELRLPNYVSPEQR
jgi:hypothetical protein